MTSSSVGQRLERIGREPRPRGGSCGPPARSKAAQPDSEQFRSSPRTSRLFGRMLLHQPKYVTSAICGGGCRHEEGIEKPWMSSLGRRENKLQNLVLGLSDSVRRRCTSQQQR